MTTRLTSLTFDANEPLRLARFWAETLGWDIHDETHAEIGLIPTDGTRFILVFAPVPEPKTEKNRLHLDLVHPTSDGRHLTRQICRSALGAGSLCRWDLLRRPLSSRP